MLLSEKHRATSLNKVVLSAETRHLCENIVLTGYFPNLLIIGSVGVGKTTTVRLLIDAYLQQWFHSSVTTHSPVMYVNASDKQEGGGIQFIENELNEFASTYTVGKPLKFVVLDEADNLSAIAQQHLIQLMEKHASTPRVRFCLLGNYMSNLCPALQSHFVLMRFHTLPAHDVFVLLHEVVKAEGWQSVITDAHLHAIQQQHVNDIRSMLCAIQQQHGLLMAQQTPIVSLINTHDIPHTLRAMANTILYEPHTLTQTTLESCILTDYNEDGFELLSRLILAIVKQLLDDDDDDDDITVTTDNNTQRIMLLHEWTDKHIYKCNKHVHDDIVIYNSELKTALHSFWELVQTM